MKPTLIAAGLLTVLAPLAVPSAVADDNSCPTTHDLRGAVVGSVSATDRDYWRLQIGPMGGGATLGEQVSFAAGVLIVLESIDGDADLYVWQANQNGACTIKVCESTNGGLVTDGCTITDPGTYYVEPQYWFDSDGKADYVLTAEAWPI